MVIMSQKIPKLSKGGRDMIGGLMNTEGDLVASIVGEESYGISKWSFFQASE